MFCPLSLRANSSGDVQTLLVHCLAEVNTNYGPGAQSQLLLQILSNRAGSLLRLLQGITTVNQAAPRTDRWSHWSHFNFPEIKSKMTKHIKLLKSRTNNRKSRSCNIQTSLWQLCKRGSLQVSFPLGALCASAVLQLSYFPALRPTAELFGRYPHCHPNCNSSTQSQTQNSINQAGSGTGNNRTTVVQVSTSDYVQPQAGY